MASRSVISDRPAGAPAKAGPDFAPTGTTASRCETAVLASIGKKYSNTSGWDGWHVGVCCGRPKLVTAPDPTLREIRKLFSKRCFDCAQTRSETYHHYGGRIRRPAGNARLARVFSAFPPLDDYPERHLALPRVLNGRIGMAIPQSLVASRLIGARSLLRIRAVSPWCAFVQPLPG